MRIRCPVCQNEKRFIVPVWIRATFRFNKDGTMTLLHTRFLEAVEEKLINGEVKCAECKNLAALVTGNTEHETLEAL